MWLKSHICSIFYYYYRTIEITDWYNSASVGAKVQNTTGMFLWDNGSQEGFNDNIVTRAPVDGENCVTIKNAKAGGLYRPQSCDVNKRFICERDY